MTIQINYKNIGSKKDLTNLVLFVDHNFSIISLKKHISNTEFSYIRKWDISNLNNPLY